jgi:hypothetical protein
LMAYIKTFTEGNDANSPRKFVLRISDGMGIGGPFGLGAVDKMHEGQRKHPRTTEKLAYRTKLWQVLDDRKYSGPFARVLSFQRWTFFLLGLNLLTQTYSTYRPYASIHL